MMVRFGALVLCLAIAGCETYIAEDHYPAITKVWRVTMRTERDFFERDWIEQESICENTWCAVCAEADIGLLNPREYQEDGQVFVEGDCARCRGRVVTRITTSSLVE